MISTIIVFLIILSGLVIVHELGHFYAAKKMGARVEEFGIGFPPRIYSKYDKSGVRWSINAILAGGFVKIKGENGEDRNDKDSFVSLPIWRRFIILVAGVIMNLLTAVVLLTVVLNIGVLTVVEGDVPTGASIDDQSIMVTQVLPDSPAASAGLQAGDKIVSINDLSFASGEQAREYLNINSDKEVFNFNIERDGDNLELTIIPEYIQAIDSLGVGAALMEVGKVKYKWYMAPWQAIKQTAVYTALIVGGIYDVVTSPFTGSQSYKMVSGPVGIADMTGEMMSLGLSSVLNFAAILSISLAVLNILPFPALDGGRIMFLIIEAVRRRPVNQKWEILINNLGFLALLVLMVIVTYKDIVNL
ncbi:RIP metalloprotease RseP [Candidatus Parcubacteria bacterium]|nr:MAG: RIP metalloprotease RseP [Candidatus Parcubacteria bacterium]